MGGNAKKVDIMIIGDFPPQFDKAIDAFRKKFPNAIIASTVPEMVNKILLKLQSEAIGPDGPLNVEIGCLRIIGHSNGNYLALSRFEGATKKIESPKDFSQSIYERALAADVLVDDKLNERFWLGNNDQVLSKLTGKFSSEGYVMLETCHIAPGFSGDLAESKIDHGPYGLYLMKGLSQLWKVPSMGGSDKQNPTPGLEGEVTIAYPNGHVEKRKSGSPGASDPPQKVHYESMIDEGLLPSNSGGSGESDQSSFYIPHEGMLNDDIMRSAFSENYQNNDESGTGEIASFIGSGSDLPPPTFNYEDGLLPSNSNGSSPPLPDFIPNLNKFFLADNSNTNPFSFDSNLRDKNENSWYDDAQLQDQIPWQPQPFGSPIKPNSTNPQWPGFPGIDDSGNMPPPDGQDHPGIDDPGPNLPPPGWGGHR